MGDKTFSGQSTTKGGDNGAGGTLKGPLRTSGESQGKINAYPDNKSVPDPLGLTKGLKDRG